MRRWGPTVLMVVVAAAALYADITAGATALGVGFTVFFLAYALVLSPALPPRSVSAARARARSAEDGRPIVYWRPGCVYCLRLRFRLGRTAGGLHWVDIWRDPEGAAAVRAITGGDETVPTVVAGDRAQVNPDPAWVRGQAVDARPS